MEGKRNVIMHYSAATMQLCVGCTLEFQPIVTLGAAEDPVGVGVFAEVLRIGDQGYLVSSDAADGVVIVYDSEGQYQRELNRVGDGPGELSTSPRFARGDNGILMHEWRSPRLHLWSDDLMFVKTFQMPVGQGGAIHSDPLTGGWLVSYLSGAEDAGILLVNAAAELIRSMRPDVKAPSLSYFTGDVIRDVNGRIWISSIAGMVDVFDEHLNRLGSLALPLPWMDEWNQDPGRSGLPPVFITDLRLAPDGSGVWIYAWVPVVDPKEIDFMPDPMPPPDELNDTFIYWVSLEANHLVIEGTDRHDRLIRPLDAGFAFDVLETPDGNRRVRVGRLLLQKRSGVEIFGNTVVDPQVVDPQTATQPAIMPYGSNIDSPSQPVTGARFNGLSGHGWASKTNPVFRSRRDRS